MKPSIYKGDTLQLSVMKKFPPVRRLYLPLTLRCFLLTFYCWGIEKSLMSMTFH